MICTYFRFQFNPTLGKDLEDALLKLFNGMKDEFLIPDFVLKQNITTIFKNKGSRQDMDNDRGIFTLTDFGASVRRSSGRRSGGRLLAMT